jgi:hypothetical protein
VSDGVTQAHALVTAANWKLVGALAYYAFDNAVLWAAFHAYGHTPPIAVVVMGYLVGSPGTSPAGSKRVSAPVLGRRDQHEVLASGHPHRGDVVLTSYCAAS